MHFYVSLGLANNPGYISSWGWRRRRREVSQAPQLMFSKSHKRYPLGIYSYSGTLELSSSFSCPVPMQLLTAQTRRRRRWS